ncbi:HAD family hydrolase [Candidatus Nanohalobium constans]|uniref:Glucose-1-phosphatase n=1 Tax=Candidatus Nanohalobium constans TaxID=2565781 RepID=A0A5Q0UH44_9ARCH|nr:HAD hydrolase-like protein [Candidatus Nanohalobium constans]QGA80906.1 glucose-1-phosphatase [Candidatus Nanohalobium constans]
MSKIPVFDIGDTLSPSKEFSRKVFREELERQGVENPPKYPYEGFNEMSVESIQEWFERDDIDADAEVAVEKYKEAKKERLKELEMFEMLRKIGKEIETPGIISDNKVAAKKFYKDMFEEENVEIEGFVVSEEIGVKKPEKGIFQEFLNRRSLSGENCVYFGNNIPRDSACENVGMQFVLVKQFEVFGDNWNGRQVSKLNFENVREEVTR